MNYKSPIMLKLLMCCIVVIPAISFSKSFSTQFMTFELPSGWYCQLEGSEYVCQSSRGENSKEAIVILAAKRKGPQDSIERYLDYLKSKKTYQVHGGMSQVSDPVYTEKKTIREHLWSIHYIWHPKFQIFTLVTSLVQKWTSVRR